MASLPTVCEVLLALDDAPGITRQLRLGYGATLGRFNRVLSASLEWPSDAPYAFRTATLHWEGEWSGRGDSADIVDVRIRQVLPDVGSKIAWEYGREGMWDGTVTLVAIYPASDLLETPLCVNATGLAPRPDDDPWNRESDSAPAAAPSLATINAILRDTKRKERRR